MAYRRGEQRAVSRYAQAGYAGDAELYIARDAAGSRRDDLRDLNRRGYAQAETPIPALQRETESVAVKHAPRKKENAFMRAWRQDRAAARLCAVLLGVIVALCVVWGAKANRGLQNRRSIEMFNQATVALIEENERLAEELLTAKNGERIRNRAQNELGMLRRERATTRQIYIQVPENVRAAQKAATEEPRIELLDVLLGILDRLHIGV